MGIIGIICEKIDLGKAHYIGFVASMALRPGRQRSRATPIIAKGFVYPPQNPCASKSDTRRRKKLVRKNELFSMMFAFGK